MHIILKLIDERLFSNGFRLRDSDSEVRITIDNDSTDIFYILTMNGNRRFNLNKISNNILAWTLPNFIDNNRVSISVQAKRINSDEVIFTSNTILIRDFYLDEDFEQYDMFNDIPIINIEDRKILMPQGKIIALNDDMNSQFLMFRIKRFINGVDISKMAISINFVNALTESDSSTPVNVSSNLDYVHFAWLINNSVSVTDGKVSFEVQIMGSNEKGNPYIWQSLPSELTITKSLPFDEEAIIDRFPNILKQLRIDVTNLENRVTDLEDRPILSTTDDVTLVNDFKVIGTSVGALENGAIVPAGKSLSYLLDAIRAKTIPPTYISPTLSISGSTPLSVEIGSNITPTIFATFNQNHAGLITNYSLKKNNINILSANNTQTFTDGQFQITSNTNYNASASFGDGVILLDNMGNPSPSGQILAGTINSNAVTYSVFRNLFYGTTMVSNPTIPITSYEIRGLSGIKNNPNNGTTISIPVPANTTMIVFAYPDVLQDVSSIISSSLSMNVTNVFTKTIVNVNGANGYIGMNYKVYSFIPAIPFGSNDVYDILI